MALTLGIVCYGWHEAAAVLVDGGRVIAAAEEERFTRKKFESGFPDSAIAFCLQRAGIKADAISAIGCGFAPRRKPLHKALHMVRYFPGSLHLIASRWPMQRRMNSIALQVREKLRFSGPVYQFNHHLCHAASSFFGSRFSEAAILTLDGAGDWESCWWGRGEGEQILELGRINWPASLGHIYAAFTEYLGFQAFSDEYRVMGLAPYGKPRFATEIARMFWPTDRGYDVDLSYFQFQTGRCPRYSRKLLSTFGPPLAAGTSDIPERYRDLAASMQFQLENVIKHLAQKVMVQSRSKKLCLAGGVAMNSVANGKLISESVVDDLYVPSCASDAGTALGAAWLAHLKSTGQLSREPLETALLGPEYDYNQIDQTLKAFGLESETVQDPALQAAHLLSEGKVVAWFQGRMEFGQRALGARSILGDPRRAEMKDIINLKVKFREPFRPFAPSVLEEEANRFFVCNRNSPFMTEVYPVRDSKRASIPAVTHVDGTARVQTVSKETNPLYWKLLNHFAELTGIPVLLNTSFNVKGQPIVNTPGDAIETFSKTDIDALVCGNRLVRKTPQAR